MMARCPFANWRPLPENNTEPVIVPTQYLLHSAVDHPGRTDLRDYFDNPGVNVESHFYIYLDGTLDQYIDTNRSADANSGANRRSDGTGAVSVETEDEGNPDERPWTEAQIKTLIRLGRWLKSEHGIPSRECRNPSDPGVGYHTMFGAPSEWTGVRGKTCPGRARIRQFPRIVAGIGGTTSHDDEEFTVAAKTIAGRNRHETAALLAHTGFPGRTGGLVFLLATGSPDGDAVCNVAMLGPVLTVEPDELPQATAKALSQFRPDEVIRIGGSGVISDSVLAAARRAAAQ